MNEHVFFFLKILLIYLREGEKERMSQGGGAAGKGEAGSPPSKEPNVGLDPSTLGSRPELKASPSEPPRRPSPVF